MIKIKVITISAISNKNMGEMTKWIFNREYKNFNNSTINLPESLISDIPRGNRSIYIKEKIAKFLTSLECKYENSCKLFPSRSELVRCALLFDVLGSGHKVPKEIENRDVLKEIIGDNHENEDDKE